MSKLNEINPEEYYTPREIRDKGWILNAKGQSNYPSYLYILRLIKQGLLKAENRGIGEKLPRHIIKGSEIIRFLQESPHLA